MNVRQDKDKHIMGSPSIRFLQFGIIVATTLTLLLTWNLAPRNPSREDFLLRNAATDIFKRTDVSSASDEDYKTAATKGQLLICWMKDPSLAGDQASSKWNDWADIAKWGWVDSTTTNWLGESAPGIKDLVPSSKDLTSADKKFQIKHLKDSPDQSVQNPDGTVQTWHYPVCSLQLMFVAWGADVRVGNRCGVQQQYLSREWSHRRGLELGE